MNAIILSALLGAVMMFSGIILKNKASIVYTALAGLVVLIVGNLLETYSMFTIHVNTHEMLVFSKFGYFFNTVAFVSTFLYVVLSGKDVVKVGNYPAEYFALIFFILSGIGILTSFNNLLMMFIGIEIVTIPLYILAGSDKKNLKSNEASLKYLLMGAFSTGLMLMGIALVYGASGSFGIEAMKITAAPIPGGPLPTAPILDVIGLMFILGSLLFKVSAAPFHFWTPDVYDGSPSVFTSFMSTIVKAGAFIAFIRLFENKAEEMGSIWKMLLVLSIIATLLVGNITAVFQQSVKRMLAYSSIAQAGFMLFALYSRNDMAKEGILLYSVAYTTATVGIFAILIKMKDYTFDGYNGLAKTQPLLAAVNTIFILSLAGIPLTAGFFAKYWMLASVMKVGGAFAIWLVIIAVVFAAVSVYYYFRVIQAMYFKEGNAETTEISQGFKIGLLVMAAIIIVVGIMPDALLGFLYF